MRKAKKTKVVELYQEAMQQVTRTIRAEVPADWSDEQIMDAIDADPDTALRWIEDDLGPELDITVEQILPYKGEPDFAYGEKSEMKVVN